jgi:RecA/RadA recombinase
VFHHLSIPPHIHTLTHVFPHSKQQEGKAPGGKVISFCKAVDAMLGGGVHKGQVTEISGLPGTGKTQIAYVYMYIYLFI